jgi:hypothetical protein
MAELGTNTQTNTIFRTIFVEPCAHQCWLVLYIYEKPLIPVLRNKLE